MEKKKESVNSGQGWRTLVTDSDEQSFNQSLQNIKSLQCNLFVTVNQKMFNWEILDGKDFHEKLGKGRRKTSK